MTRAGKRAGASPAPHGGHLRTSSRYNRNGSLGIAQNESKRSGRSGLRGATCPRRYWRNIFRCPDRQASGVQIIRLVPAWVSDYHFGCSGEERDARRSDASYPQRHFRRLKSTPIAEASRLPFAGPLTGRDSPGSGVSSGGDAPRSTTASALIYTVTNQIFYHNSWWWITRLVRR